MSSKPLRLGPLGGLGEVGKNMMALEYGENILVIDAGMMFPENDMLGIDYIIPDFRYLLDKKHKVRGIIVTHGHEDHTGAIRHLLEQLEAPIYSTPLTHAAPAIPGGGGLETPPPAGLVVHSGDFKFDHTPVDGWPTDFGKLGELGGRGGLALLSDSTNAEKPGWTPSEAGMDPALDSVFAKARGRILVATFASLISRMAQVGEAAARPGRKVAFVGPRRGGAPPTPR